MAPKDVIIIVTMNHKWGHQSFKWSGLKYGVSVNFP